MSRPDVQAALRAAIAHHQAGRWPEADAAYRAVLSEFPGHPDALHMLGLLAFHQGRPEVAVELIGDAIRRAPGHPASHSNLGNALLVLGRLEEAMASFGRALELKSDFFEAHNNLGNAFKSAGRIDEAFACYQRALALRPDFAEAHNNLGLLLAERGAYREAVACYEHALRARPDFVEALSNLGVALEAAGSTDAAMANLERALALKPESPASHNNLGNVLKGRGRFADAEQSYRRALALQPAYAEAHSNLGLTLAAEGRVDEALLSFDRAIELRPDLAEANWNKGITLLLKGDYENGWPLYEWRWKAIEKRALIPRFEQPLWTGDVSLAGKALLVHHEQGLGDTLMVLRYVPLLAAQGARVFLQMPPVLAPLAREVQGVSDVVIEGDPLPPFDLHCPMMTLPLAFRTLLSTIPGEVPYLFAPPPLVLTWRNRLGPKRRRRIGLAWRGSVSQLNDARPIPLAELLPRLDCHSEYFSLQKDYLPAEEALLRSDGRINDFSAQLTDLAETAAFIAQMDLVLSIDTAVAHLAGGMGKPVWLMLPFAPDFRWLLERGDSPWYPTMRLFRQQALADWRPVLAEVSEALAE